MTLCPVCGNENQADSRICRYCGADIDTDEQVYKPAPPLYKAVNLEKGRPTVETALRRLEAELKMAAGQRVRVLTLIHGYGSSGRGGKIRIECRKVLDHHLQNRKLESFIAGERFSRRSGPGKALLRRYPGLEHYCGSDFNNPGVTIVVF